MVRGELIHDPEHGWIGHVDWSTQDVWESSPAGRRRSGLMPSVDDRDIDGRNVTTPFTAKQGQYLAYIYYYTKIHGRAPAEADLQRYFRVTPPAVHQMIKTLEVHGLIDREPGAAR
jgi:hypothetical protein